MKNRTTWTRARGIGARVALLALPVLTSALAAPLLVRAATPAPARAPATPAVAAATAATAAQPERPDWAQTLERIANSVVTIEVDQTRSFDTERNTTAQATGFVIDAERGLILTNRHVVTPGPVTAEATFLNREEVQLYPVYRDPIHDFGIYHYDPSKLRFIKPASLPLAPEGAVVGREIRVVGNNAGEQLSILAGTLARLDREAPDYGIGRYNDFNTFYIQAASGTSGGSSGSPVIDVQGRVVGLNAGGATGAASSFYLPLGRVKRALQLIQAGKSVARGTLETEFQYRPYDELRRLGLRTATETEARQAAPTATGMLVVSNVQPGSVADGQLSPGDVLVRVNGKLVTQFEPLDSVMDDSVGGIVELQFERGGQPLITKLKVENLDAITPASYLELGDSVVHTLSYQMARHFHVPIKGVFVASQGYMLAAAGVPRGAVIRQLNGKPVDTVDDFQQIIGELGDGARISLRYFTLDNPRSLQLQSARVDRRWFPAQRCRRDDTVGIWPCTALPMAAVAAAPVGGTVQYPSYEDSHAAKLAPSLVSIRFDMPYSVSGVTERNYHGTGLVIDAKQGLIITDRNTVPVSLGDVRLTFGGMLEIPGEVRYIHPLHNLAVIHYDPKLLGNTPVKAAVLATQPLKAGENVRVVGLDNDGEIKVRSTQVSAVDPVQLPLSRSVQFRESNLSVASLVNGPDDLIGVLADDKDRIRGLWASFASDNGRELVQQTMGIGSDLIAETLELARSDAPLFSLEAELLPQQLASARQLGLTDAWVAKILKANPRASQVLGIVRLVGGSDAQKVLQQGDLLLAIDGQVVTDFRAVERAVGSRPNVKVTVWRPDGEHEVAVNTAKLTGADLTRVLEWAGATLQAPHRAISAQRGLLPEGVYVSYYNFGSPATRFGLNPGRRILEVDGQAVPNLDAFIKNVSGRADRASLRIKTEAWNGAQEVITLKLDRQYWPAYELNLKPEGWERHALE